MMKTKKKGMKQVNKHFMWKALFVIIVFFCGKESYAQEKTYINDLPVLYINQDVTLHFRSPESINYIDISTNKMIGDIPIENVAKIKCLPEENFRNEQDLGIVSIVGESYLAQYRIKYKENSNVSEVEITQEQMKPLQYPSITLTEYEMRKISLDIQKKSRKLRKTQSKGMGLSAFINNIYSYGDYIFLDITFQNHTNIKYDVDEINFKIEDKKIYKETNNQSIQIYPVFSLYSNIYFLKNYRNVFVFDKFTFPNDKVLKIRLLEKQISGRALELIVEYRDLLNSDTI